MPIQTAGILKPLSAEQVLGAARYLFSAALPHARSILIGTVQREAPGLGTFAMTQTGIMLYDPQYVVSLNAVEECAGVVYHELLHWLLKHFDRIPVALKPEWMSDAEFHHICNVGFDYSIYAIVTAVFPMPRGSVKPSDDGLSEGMTGEFYIAKLVEKAEAKRAKQGGAQGSQGQQGKSQSGSQNGAKGSPGAPGQGQGQGEGQGAQESGAGAQESGAQAKPTAKVGQGSCGSAAGNPVEGEPAIDDPEARTVAQSERVRKEVARVMREAARAGRGTANAEMSRFVEATLEPAKVPWTEKLRRTVHNAAAFRGGAQVYRFDGPSRRQAGIGYGASKPVAPRLRAPVARVACVVDTSGSMGQAEMKKALREIRGVMNAVRADVEFMAIDRKVHSLAKVKRVEDIAPLLKGGGGTDFRPAFEALAKRHPRPDIIVFVTDGDGPAPATEPSWCRTIWTLVGKHDKAPCTWGEAVNIDGEDD